jgi:hypothetical protein
MKLEKIVAYNGTGTSKVYAGEKMEQRPEKVDEALTLWGEEKLLAYAWSSHAIVVQRQIRDKSSDSAKNQLAALELYARQNPDSDVAKTLALMKTKGAAFVNAQPPQGETGGDTNGTSQETAPTPEAPATPSEPEKAPEEKAPARGRRR